MFGQLRNGILNAVPVGADGGFPKLPQPRYDGLA
jgi:hypothetical protein